MIKQISSIQNPLIKELYQLKEKSRARKKTARFLIEGKREISLALKGFVSFVYSWVLAPIYSECVKIIYFTDNKVQQPAQL